MNMENIGITPHNQGKCRQTYQAEAEKVADLYHLKYLEIEITLRCPLRCIHCSVNGGIGKLDIPIEKFKEIVDDCEKLGVEVLDIIGGEPLAYPNIYEAIEYALQKIPKVYLSTAGYFINGKMIEKLKKTGIKNIFVSIDGHNKQLHEMVRGSGTFEATCEAVKNLSDAGFDVTISFVANNLNYQYIDKMIELSESLGAKKLFVIALIPEGRGKNISQLTLNEDAIKYLLGKYRHHNGTIELEFDCSLKTNFSDMPKACKICPAGTTFATVAVNGDVFPCGFLRDHKFFKAGNIYEESLYNIWKGDNIPSLSYFRKSFAGCDGCPIYFECRGGCQALKRGKACNGNPQERIELFRKLEIIS